MANEIIIIHYIYYMCIYIYIYLSHYIEPILWLVVSTNPSEKWWSSWDWIIIPTIGEHQIHVPVTTNQIYIYIYCQAPGWLKTFGQFLVLWGGGGARLVQTWVWPFFVHRLAGAGNKKFGVGKHLFWCQISIFWWKVGAENHFFGVQNAFFGVRKLWWNFLRVSMKLPGKHGGGEVNDVCVFISPPCTKTGQLLKPIRGYLNRLLFFRPS